MTSRDTEWRLERGRWTFRVRGPVSAKVGSFLFSRGWTARKVPRL